MSGCWVTKMEDKCLTEATVKVCFCNEDLCNGEYTVYQPELCGNRIQHVNHFVNEAAVQNFPAQCSNIDG